MMSDVMSCGGGSPELLFLIGPRVFLSAQIHRQIGTLPLICKATRYPLLKARFSHLESHVKFSSP